MTVAREKPGGRVDSTPLPAEIGLKDNHMSRERAKMALRSFAYSYLDVDVNSTALTLIG